MNPFFTDIFYKLTVFASGLFIITVLVLLLKKKTRKLFWSVLGVILSFFAFLPTLYQQWNYLSGTTISYWLPSKITNSSSSVCFSGGGTLTIRHRVSTDVVQCHHTDTRTLYYSFLLPVDEGGTLQIIGFRGTFGIDQENVNFPRAVAVWQIYYNGDVICSVTAHWRRPGHCTNVPDTAVVEGDLLIIKQTVNGRTADASESLFAGIIDPVLVLKEYQS